MHKSILITGYNGFLGKNLYLLIKSMPNIKVLKFGRNDDIHKLSSLVKKSEIILHCAAEIKSSNKKAFIENNVLLTKKIIESAVNFKKKIKIIHFSTKSVIKNNNYGITKKLSEKEYNKPIVKKNITFQILRLPNLFGKYAKVNHNSVVANFCYNISRNKKVYISKKSNVVKLLYIDDLLKEISGYILGRKKFNNNIINIKHNFIINLENLLNIIRSFKQNRDKIITHDSNNKFINNLYSTYLHYLPSKELSKKLKPISDKRGSFVELIKNKHFGQFSILIVNKGGIRGGHFHNSKIERFFTIGGSGYLTTKDIHNNKINRYELKSKFNRYIEIQPGLLHSIKNTGKGELKVLIWANDIYNSIEPDTYKIEEN